MTDRELLELAAKAAGITDYEYCELIGDEPALYSKAAHLGIWAPLTDDGDALRLAVKLQFRVGIEELQAGAITVEWGSDFDECVEESVPDESCDPFAATRRAIVRAAAEIGKSMLESAAADTPVNKEVG